MEGLTNLSSAKPFLLLTLHLTLISLLINPTPASSSDSEASKQFIRSACNATIYSSLCIKTLTPSAAAIGTSPLALCHAALTAAIHTTTNCTAAASNSSGFESEEAAVIEDCIGDMKDAVYELKETVNAMEHLGNAADREFQWANAKTYASAAITDAETCIDGFPGREVSRGVKKKMRGCVNAVEKLISNALALINHLY